VGAWYWIGVSTGLGAGAGVFLAGGAGATRVLLVASGAAAILAGALVGLGIDEWRSGGWADIAAGAVGGLFGLLGAAQTVSGALRRGGTRVATALLVGCAALVVAAVAWIPVAGYVVALALLVLAALLQRARPERYAGLRTLARDE
jgi:hypothetical protein